MDVIEDILTTTGLTGALYFRTDFNAPWAVTVPELSDAARFHLVIQGQCVVQIQNGDQVLLGSGDLVLIPRGRSHILSDRPTGAAPALETVLCDAGYDGNGVLAVGTGDESASTQMVCGHLSFRKGADHPLLRAFPQYILTTATDRARQPLLDDLLRLVTRRIFTEQLGSVAAVSRMSEIVFIELLRAGVGQDPGLANVIAAFRDQQIGRALELIHESPGAQWSVERLASEVGMSRSRFADRFSATLGQGPMAYLADWRLQKALSLLEDARWSIQEIAGRIGYRSPAAFTRAFSDRFGRSPREYRRAV